MPAKAGIQPYAKHKKVLGTRVRGYDMRGARFAFQCNQFARKAASAVGVSMSNVTASSSTGTSVTASA
jgi:hypothetical protein